MRVAAAAAVPLDENPRARAKRIGQAKAQFDRIRVDYPPTTDALEQMETVRIAGEHLPPGAPRGGAFLVAALGVAKTETLREYERIVNGEAESGRRPALRIEIGTSGYSDTIPIAILTQLAERRPTAGNEQSKWARAKDALREHGVTLLMIDEFNRAARRSTISASIALSVQQHILDEGICPVIIVGSERAGDVLKLAPSVHERLDDSLELPVLDWGQEADRLVVVEFLRDFDAALVENGLLAGLSRLDEGDVPSLLCRAAAGKLRALVKTLRVAFGLAIERGDVAMSRQDLADGVAAYCVRQRLVTINPFHDISKPAVAAAERISVNRRSRVGKPESSVASDRSSGATPDAETLTDHRGPA